MSAAPIVITGRAYGRRATLEIAGDTLTWRAQRGPQPIAENIATTIHDLRDARWLDVAWSPRGVVLLGFAALWALIGATPGTAVVALLGLGLVIWRRLRPRQVLVLELGDRELVLQVTGGSADAGRALAARIRQALASGESPRETPVLP